VRRKGFTLAEMIIVLGIIAMISSVGVIQFTNQASKTREDQLRQDLQVVRTAVKAFYEDTLFYPTTLNDLSSRTAPSSAANPTTGAGSSYETVRWRGPYLDRVPVDPISRNAFSYLPGDTGFVRSSATGNDSKGVAFSSY
jgi:general secretion pathway protein G